MQFSVIIPVYNVVNYIAHCVKSLMEQTLTNVEFIFIDDTPPDDSIDILESILNCYPNRQTDVKKYSLIPKIKDYLQPAIQDLNRPLENIYFTAIVMTTSIHPCWKRCMNAQKKLMLILYGLIGIYQCLKAKDIWRCPALKGPKMLSRLCLVVA